MPYPIAELGRIAQSVVIVLAVCTAAGAQQSAGSASSSTNSKYSIMGASPSSSKASSTQNKSLYLPTTDGPPVDEVNRKALESHAGSDAGKMLLRSTPTGARILVDGAFVGRTPLLLIVAPGKYRVEMQNERQASADRTVELAAKGTQEIALTLVPKYPDRVTAH